MKTTLMYFLWLPFPSTISIFLIGCMLSQFRCQLLSVMYVITSFLKEYLNAWFLGKALGQRRSIWLNGTWKGKTKRKNKQTTTTTPLSIACEPALRPHHTPCKELWIPESGNFLLVEFGILGLGIRNTAQGIRNPTNDCNPESKFH